MVFNWSFSSRPYDFSSPNPQISYIFFVEYETCQFTLGVSVGQVICASDLFLFSIRCISCHVSVSFLYF